MYSGLQKAQLILSLLDDKAGLILSKLSPSASSLLGGSMGDMPEQTDETLKPLLKEFHENLEAVQKIPEDPFGIDLSEPMEASGFDISSEVEEALGESLSKADDSEKSDKAKHKPYFDKPERVVVLLREQKPQVAAFLYNRLDDPVKLELQDHLSEDEIEKYEQGKVEEIPLSERVFKSMVASLKEESEREEEESPDEDDESGVDDFSFSGASMSDDDSDDDMMSLSSDEDSEPVDQDGLDMSLEDDDESADDDDFSLSNDPLLEMDPETPLSNAVDDEVPKKDESEADFDNINL